MNKIILSFKTILPLFTVCVLLSNAEEFPTSTIDFSGPEQVDNRIKEDEKDRQRPLKERLKDEGINLAIDYSAVALKVDESLPDTNDSASGGMLRFYGSWDATSTGSLIWKVEYRHSYTETEPRFLAFNAGIIGLEVPPFSDQGTRLTNLYWKQKFNDGKATIMAGFLDVTDYVDVYAVASPWTGFFNFAFSTGSTTMVLPNDATLGLAAATMLGDNFFVIGSITDMEADATKPFEGFDTLFSKHNLFSSLELGWTSDQSNIYTDNIHLTLWHTDESEIQGLESEKGVNFSMSRLYGSWLPFLRAGYADKGVMLGIDRSVSAGFQYYGLGNKTNNLGFAVNWANDVATNEKQTIAELFYFMKLGEYFELTPDIQWIDTPQNGDRFVYGLRARVVW